MRQLLVVITIFLTLIVFSNSVLGQVAYPTYPEYVAMMEDFANNHKDRASLVEIGKSVKGRKLLAIRITTEGDTTMRPSFFLTSTMHGNETTGYLLSLRLIDTLLSINDQESKLYKLISRSILYINPLANPDGTYRNDDFSVEFATRENFNNVDLNRNFPSISGTDSNIPEMETIAMMNFAKSRGFSMSINMHGGDEVLNFPWDSFKQNEKSLPDLEWWQTICKEYVDTVRLIEPNYLRSVNNAGYVFGSEWYKVEHSRQDWMMYEMRCRELTLELSNTKTIAAEYCDYYWNLNKNALINYMLKVCQGITGYVADMQGNTLAANIILNNYDEDCSSVFTNTNGIYFRPTLGDKIFEVCALADGYECQCQSVGTLQDSLVVLNFMLRQRNELQTSIEGLVADNAIQIETNENKILIKSNEPINYAGLYTINGQVVWQNRQRQKELQCETYNLASGIYVCRINTNNMTKTQKILITK